MLTSLTLEIIMQFILGNSTHSDYHIITYLFTRDFKSEQGMAHPKCHHQGHP